jgi:putative transposase
MSTVDMGVTVPLALSDGKTYDHGKWLTEKEQAKLLCLGAAGRTP